jgi:hypothetical protein
MSMSTSASAKRTGNAGHCTSSSGKAKLVKNNADDCALQSSSRVFFGRWHSELVLEGLSVREENTQQETVRDVCECSTSCRSIIYMAVNEAGS